ncbi:PAS domain S-box-containing protein [Catalinimonas alkaloidigena]|uniref:histidine kinase n=1 Tax=Catalinimonas alkaloidigena TaxID=1075417 RepID=A0A1G9BRV6_9BACT|nr:PAS domain-containing hybrid sensor histidine kinase/response regulator [Catalinimonas alkaloidigena]SDK42030.1 PAS domain S-box-containing protein [Catalinimonas alkaloidigena]
MDQPSTDESKKSPAFVNETQSFWERLLWLRHQTWENWYEHLCGCLDVACDALSMIASRVYMQVDGTMVMMADVGRTAQNDTWPFQLEDYALTTPIGRIAEPFYVQKADWGKAVGCPFLIGTQWGVIMLGAPDFSGKLEEEQERFLRAVAEEVRFIIAEYRTYQQRNRAESELYASKMQFKTLLDATAGAVLQLSSEPIPRIDYVSQGIMRLTGYPAEYYLGRLITDVVDKIHPEDYERLAVYVEDARSAPNNQVHSQEFRIYHQDGSLKWILYQGQVIQTSRDTMLVGVVLDITERKRMVELTRERDLAESALQLKSEFLANISHEIRTPLNGLIGMTELMLESPLTSQQEEYTQIIRRSSENLLTIINDILDFSKLEAGKMQMREAAFELPRTLKQVKELFTPLVRKKALNLTLQVAPTVPRYLTTDETRLTQILTNLVSNAIKFTDAGEVGISVDKVGESLLRFCVKDTGPGISAENQHKLFQPFSQLDMSSTRRYGGTGLGLAICQNLVQMLGGEIGIESSGKGGSVFWFTLPYKAATRQHINPPQHRLQADHVGQYSAHVLLVEDQEMNGRVATLILEKLGCRVSIARNGVEALDLFASAEFDFILMDIQMPVMDGIQATQALRRQYANVPPIVGLSANALEGDAEKYIRLGLDDYLAKPLVIGPLAEKLRKWLPESMQSTLEGASAESAPALVNSKQVLNRTIIEQIKQYAGNDLGAIQEVINSFINDGKALVLSLKQAWRKGQIAEVQMAVHTLKGLCGTLGAEQMHELTNALNQHLIQERFENVGELQEQIGPAWAQLTQELRKYMYDTLQQH